MFPTQNGFCDWILSRAGRPRSMKSEGVAVSGGMADLLDMQESAEDRSMGIRIFDLGSGNSVVRATEESVIHPGESVIPPVRR